jgi:hypothetical protein
LDSRSSSATDLPALTLPPPRPDSRVSTPLPPPLPLSSLTTTGLCVSISTEKSARA